MEEYIGSAVKIPSWPDTYMITGFERSESLNMTLVCLRHADKSFETKVNISIIKFPDGSYLLDKVKK